jgi:hypothetical protein
MANPVIRNHLVAFIDLLGQRKQMEELLFIPPRSQIAAREDFRSRITRLMGAFAFVQQNISHIAQASNSHHLEAIEGVDTAVQAQLQKYRATDVSYQPFSDGIVLFSPLSTEGHFPLGSVYSLLCACSSIMLLTLDKGFPIRAGIAIGAGCNLNGGGIYGPVVAEAYRLESEVAKYVRIVVHNEFIPWLDSFVSREYPSEQDRRVAAAMVAKCREMVTVDIDGVLILDFLSPTSLTLLGGIEANAQPIAGMRDFVGQMLTKFAQEENEHILSKYKWLNRYIDSRL